MDVIGKGIASARPMERDDAHDHGRKLVLILHFACDLIDMLIMEM